MTRPRTKTTKPDSQLVCRDCKHSTAHEVLFEEKLSGEFEQGYWWYEEYRVVRCRGCRTVAFERTSRDSESFDHNGEPDERQDIYPRPNDREPMADSIQFLGWPIDRIYKEMLDAHNSNLPLLATVGVRTLVEAICIEQGAKKYKLEQKIDELVTNGVWPPSYRDALHEIRFLGNDAAHRFATVSRKEWTEALEVVEHVMRIIYVLPAQAERLQQRRARREAKKKNP